MKLKLPKGYILSPLFPFKTPPSRPGVYLVELDERRQNYSKWDGSEFKLISNDIKRAEILNRRSNVIYLPYTMYKGWCGLLKIGSCAKCGHALRDHSIHNLYCPKMNANGLTLGWLFSQFEAIKQEDKHD